jgi:hypothetical protein
MAQEWVRTVADQRLHGTICRQPAEAFPEEPLRPPHARPPYRLDTTLCRKVASDCLVTLETYRYSMPGPRGPDYGGALERRGHDPDEPSVLKMGGTPPCYLSYLTGCPYQGLLQPHTSMGGFKPLMNILKERN